MRTPLLCLVVLAVVPCVVAAPAPERGLKAKEKLEALKKRLPEAVSTWAKERWYASETVEVRVVRMLGPSQAKVVLMSRSAIVLMSRASDVKRVPVPEKDTVFTIFLDFYDGTWSATRFDGDMPTEKVRFLMLAIDEAAEKP